MEPLVERHWHVKSYSCTFCVHAAFMPRPKLLQSPSKQSVSLHGMLHLHSHKPSTLHRDLKSPNMLVERHWRVKVTDFNLSRMVQTNGSGSSVNSLLANNPRWLAPEVRILYRYQHLFASIERLVCLMYRPYLSKLCCFTIVCSNSHNKWLRSRTIVGQQTAHYKEPKSLGSC